MKQKTIQQSEAQHNSEITQVKERLQQEESTVAALRQDMLSKDQHLKKLRTSVKEVNKVL